MSIKDFIRKAHYKPNDYMAYHVGRELAELHPGKTILEGQTWYFDLEAFVRAGRCSLVEDKSVFQHVTMEWEGVGKLKEHIQNAWLNVLWKGHLLDVVLITWTEAGYRRRHHWIIAEERQIAAEFFDAVCEWACEVRGEILVFQDGYFDKDPQLYDSIKNATFENLILPQSLKHEIRNDFERFFHSRQVYEQYGIAWKRGAIFIGPPGNGKTHTIKALINELSKPCVYVRSFEDEDDMIAVFMRARMVAPCVVVLEDIDAMVNDNNRAFLLNELDGFRANTGVVVLATTNHPEKLDSAILDRPSRFDRKYYFELPARSERFAYIARWNEGLQAEMRVTEMGATRVARETEGFSFAYLKELCVASMLQWMSAGGAMDQVMPAQVEVLRGQMNSN